MSSGATWKQEGVASAFVENRASFIPYGADQQRMLLQVIAHFRPEPRRVLDLGCGDGAVARVVLQAYPNARAVLLDHSEPMLARARESMAPWGDRVEIRSADLAQPLAGIEPGVDLVVSGYAIHHLEHERKQALYAEIFELLAPGGLFVNLEHVASASPAGEALFNELYIDFITETSGRPREAVAESFHNRPDQDDNILAPVEAQLVWLRTIGYEHADCWFKWLELAIFGGRRPASG